MSEDGAGVAPGPERSVPLLQGDPPEDVCQPRHLPLAPDHHGDGDRLLQHGAGAQQLLARVQVSASISDDSRNLIIKPE